MTTETDTDPTDQEPTPVQQIAAARAQALEAARTARARLEEAEAVVDARRADYDDAVAQVRATGLTVEQTADALHTSKTGVHESRRRRARRRVDD
ncbi:hypothetical protein [Kocuria sp. CPCC 205263]|uniref:hypothetical protein n=1 Tax=Kocuria sp. CPCC 205263 TaxID=3073555 RepID=UPI0034D562EE